MKAFFRIVAGRNILQDSVLEYTDGTARGVWLVSKPIQVNFLADFKHFIAHAIASIASSTMGFKFF